MLDFRYPWHEQLVGAARARSELWRLGLGVVLVAMVVLGLNAALQGLLFSAAPDLYFDEFANADTQGGTPLAMLILLGSFGFVTIGVFVAARVLHQRGAWSVLGHLPDTVRQFWQVLKMLVLLGVALTVLPPYGDALDLQPNLDLSRWLLLLPFSLMAVLVQTSAEEILFRGYVQQQLAARFRSPLVWMILPSALFALGHYLPVQAGENALAIAAWAGIFGILMADLTARAGTLGPAMAVHFANNVGALLVISLPDSLNGLALYTVPFSMNDATEIQQQLPVDFGVMFVSWLAARLALRR